MSPYRENAATSTDGGEGIGPSACRCGATLLRVGSGECARCERDSRQLAATRTASWRLLRAACWLSLAIYCFGRAAHVGLQMLVSHLNARPVAATLDVRNVVTAQPSAVTSVVGSGASVTCDPVAANGESTCQATHDALNVADLPLGEPVVTQTGPVNHVCWRHTPEAKWKCSSGVAQSSTTGAGSVRWETPSPIITAPASFDSWLRFDCPYGAAPSSCQPYVVSGLVQYVTIDARGRHGASFCIGDSSESETHHECLATITADSEEMAQDRAELAAAAPALVRALLAVEWEGSTSIVDRVCPECASDAPGH